MLFKQRLRRQKLCRQRYCFPFAVNEITLCCCVGIVVFDFLHDRHRIMLRQNRSEHIKRTNIGRGFTAPIRIRREYKICERLPNHISLSLLLRKSTYHAPYHQAHFPFFFPTAFLPRFVLPTSFFTSSLASSIAIRSRRSSAISSCSVGRWSLYLAAKMRLLCKGNV